MLGRVPQDTLAFFFRRLVTLISVGVPIHQALDFVSRDDDPRLAAALEAVVKRVESGWQLSAAMSEHPYAFSNVTVQMIGAGERAGTLPEVADQLSDYLERTVRLERKLRAAFTYPLLLLGLTLAIVTVMGVFVFPKEKEMLESLGGELPLITRLMIGFFDTVFNPWLVASVAGCLALLAVTWPWVGGPFYERHCRRWVDGLLLRLPVVGPILFKASASRLLYAMSALLKSGVAMGQPMTVIAGVAGNEALKERFLASQKALIEGGGLYASLLAHDVFPPMALQMIRVAEEEGHLDAMARRVAGVFEEDVDFSLSTLAALMEPLALFVMGFVVGFVVLASALPTMNMIQQI